jgi:hypothetical protein
VPAAASVFRRATITDADDPEPRLELVTGVLIAIPERLRLHCPLLQREDVAERVRDPRRRRPRDRPLPRPAPLARSNARSCSTTTRVRRCSLLERYEKRWRNTEGLSQSRQRAQVSQPFPYPIMLEYLQAPDLRERPRFQGLSKWARLGSNQRPPACEEGRDQAGIAPLLAQPCAFRATSYDQLKRR